MNQTRIDITVRRNKRDFRIGVLKGGRWWEHLAAHIRLFYWNLVTRARRKHNG